MSFKPDDIAQIRKYLNGELDARGMHRFEKRAQEDPFLMDALDGYSNRKDQQNNLDDMQRKLQKRMHTRAKTPLLMWPLVAVAIAVLALILLGAWWVLFNGHHTVKKKGQSAMVKKHTCSIYKNAGNPGWIVSISYRRPRLVLIASAVNTIQKDTTKKKANRDTYLVRTSDIPILAIYGFRQITGRVTTVIGGIPIPQAIIWNKSTDRQYATDNKGNFAIDARTGDELYVGYDGFKNQKVVVGKKNKLNIDLERKDASMYDAAVKGMNFTPFDDRAHPAIGWDNFRSTQNKLRSPDGKTGTVKLSFLVNTDNTISNITVLESVSTEADAAVIKYIKEDTRWLHNTNGKPETITLKMKLKK